jgi:hypothetical protein
MSAVAATAALVAREFRIDVWRAHGASAAEAAELLEYAASPLHASALEPRVFPLPDAPCIEHWRRYVDESDAAAVVRRVFVQLQFPIRAGASADPAYQTATRRGVRRAEPGAGCAVVCPDGLRVFLHPTAGGQVPVVVAAVREDFETLVRAIVHRNEPEPVPPSMGACMIVGYNNWERLDRLRAAFQAEHPEDLDGQLWAEAFREIVPRHELYQDRFMILSSGPYSSVPAEALGLDDEDWRAKSLRLRLEHECTHYVMRQAWGTMRKSLLDELVADYMGLVEAFGAFRADHFLRFMGLEEHPRFRAGGRLANYRGTPSLSDGAFRVLRSVAHAAAQNLAQGLTTRGPLDVVEKARNIMALTRVGLEALASPEARTLIRRAEDEARLFVLAPPRSA